MITVRTWQHSSVRQQKRADRVKLKRAGYIHERR